MFLHFFYSYLDWKYDIGFVNENILRTQLYPAFDNTIVLMCGPPAMINYACNPALDKLGFHSENRFTY